MKWVNLGDITKIRTGRLNANAADQDGEYPFFTCSVDPLKIDQYSYDCECVLVAGNGDLNVKYYNGKFDAYQRVYIIESNNNEKYRVKYLYYFLKGYVQILRDNSIGGVIKYIRLGDLENARIPALSIDEQDKIIDILQQSEAIISKRKQQIEALSSLKQSLFLDMFGDPYSNNKQWSTGRIGELTSSTQYGSSKKADENIGEYPILRMSNITYEGNMDLSDLKYIDLNEKDKEKHLVYQDELLFNRTNSRELVGKTGVYNGDEPVAFAGYLIKLIPNEKANTRFISGYLNSVYGKKILFNMAKNSIGMSNINAKELRMIRIYTPPIELQNKYAETILEIDKKEKLLKKGLQQLNVLFNALSQKAFNGELFND